ncbi:MAG: chemotaxis protein CheW [Desulfobulbaceae bacterium]|nr:chemotaxis protein CheW [Desulfobulbaceae bacterium]
MDILLFKPENDFFGIDLMAADEILNMALLRKIPAAPTFMAGLLNLRGDLLPVVDLLFKLGFTRSEPPPPITKNESVLSPYCKDTKLLVTKIAEKKVVFIIDGLKQILTIETQISKRKNHPDADSFLGDMIVREDGTTIQRIDLNLALSVEEIDGLGIN